MSDDTAAIAAFGAAMGLANAATIAAQWVKRDDDDKIAFRAIARAVTEANRQEQPAELAAAMAETRTLTGHLDHATRLMLDLGSDQLAASARRIRKAAGIES